jgi:pilus assembly protein CpaE
MRGGLRSDAGQVEFSGMLPLILLTVLTVWEAFLIGMSMTYAGHAANEGARVAAVGGDYDQVRAEAVRRVSGTWADKDNIAVRYPSHPCAGHTPPDPRPYDPDCGYVRVSIKPPLIFPGFLLPLTVSARTRVIYEGRQ